MSDMSDFICYRFPDEETFRALAAAEGLINEAGELITNSHDHTIVELKELTKNGVTMPGWHVNTSGFAPPAWDAHLIIVNSACNIFLGGPDRAPDDETLEEMVQ